MCPWLYPHCIMFVSRKLHNKSHYQGKWDGLITASCYDKHYIIVFNISAFLYSSCTSNSGSGLVAWNHLHIYGYHPLWLGPRWDPKLASLVGFVPVPSSQWRKCVVGFLWLTMLDYHLDGSREVCINPSFLSTTLRIYSCYMSAGYGVGWSL